MEFFALLLFICQFFHWVRVRTTTLSFRFGEIRPWSSAASPKLQCLRAFWWARQRTLFLSHQIHNIRIGSFIRNPSWPCCDEFKEWPFYLVKVYHDPPKAPSDIQSGFQFYLSLAYGSAWCFRSISIASGLFILKCNGVRWSAALTLGSAPLSSNILMVYKFSAKDNISKISVKMYWSVSPKINKIQALASQSSRCFRTGNYSKLSLIQ